MRRNSMLGFVLSLLLILGINAVCMYLFQVIFHWNYYIAMSITNLVLAYLFATLNYYNGPKLQAFKDPAYHKSVAIHFVILMAIDFMYLYLTGGF